VKLVLDDQVGRRESLLDGADDNSAVSRALVVPLGMILSGAEEGMPRAATTDAAVERLDPAVPCHVSELVDCRHHERGWIAVDLLVDHQDRQSELASR
jgi:hypothetical protein